MLGILVLLVYNKGVRSHTFSFYRHKNFITALFGAFFLFFSAAGSAYAANELFYVDQSFDTSGRERIGATQLYEGIHARFFVEDEFVVPLNSVGRKQLTDALQDLSDTFDTKIYPRLTRTFGMEWKPGIDGDYKITVLLTPMRNGAGGYFRTEDEQLAGKYPQSNEREMVYLNADLIMRFHTKEFLAHEFQHLINYNQKNRAWNKAEEVWMNEFMSEAAPWVAGLYEGEDFVFEKSNLRDRVQTFMSASSDALLDWPNRTEDYGIAAIFSYYLYEQYGDTFFTAVSLSSQTGSAAFEEALASVGQTKSFRDIFQDWMVAVLVNNCSVPPGNLYCFKSPYLNFNNLHISFNAAQVGGTSFASKESTADWAGNWYRYQRSTQETPLYLNVSFASPSSRAAFGGRYVLTYTGGRVVSAALPFIGQSSFWSVENFGPGVRQLDIALGNFFEAKPTAENPPAATFDLIAAVEEQKVGYLLTQQSVTSTAVQSTASQQPASYEPEAGSGQPKAVITDGDLVHAQGDTKVYIVKIVCPETGACAKYRRWVQTADIFGMYGHLRWENIKEVSQIILAEYQESFLVRLEGDPRVYLTDASTTKRWVETEQAFLDRGYQWGMIYTINDREFNWYHMGNSIR